MKNQEIAQIFYKISEILEFKNVQWKPQAYIKAARQLESLQEDVEDIFKKGGIKALKEIPGIGEGLAKKIAQYIETGKINEYEKLKQAIPKGLIDIMEIAGMGPKRAKILYQKLGIDTIEKLKESAELHKISSLPTFKEKSEENILKGIELIAKGKERILLGYALPIAKEIEEQLKKLKEVKNAIAAGSLRRMKETIRDIDILVTTTNAEKVVDFFTNMPIVSRILAKGDTKASIITKDGIQVDIRLVDENVFGSALLYFTGSKDHNISVRRIAMKKGYKLNEYGLFKGKKLIASKTEEEVYKKLGLQYIPPELREDKGEIEFALKNKLPELINYKDIKGDLHVHTKWSDGFNSIEDVAIAAKKLSYEFITISDHSGSLRIAHGLDKKRLLKQMEEIDKLNKKLDIAILKGAEIDIKADGNLDMDIEMLKQLDVVSVSIHSGFKFPKEKMTKRILKALDNRYVNILSHPSGRLIGQREPYAINFEKIFDKAKERRIALEINALPDRLDLNDINVKEAVAKKVKLAIGTDSHSVNQLNHMEFGVAVARRGWAEKDDVINTYDFNKLMNFLKH